MRTKTLGSQCFLAQTENQPAMSGSLRQKDLRYKQLRQTKLANVSLRDNEIFLWSRGGLKDGPGAWELSGVS